MSSQGLQVIDHTVQLTHEWINEVTERLGWASKRSALHLLRSVLHLVRDRLSTDELAHFSAQLPILIRGMLFEGWTPGQPPPSGRSVEAITSEINKSMGSGTEFRGIDDIRYVFELLNNRISRGEVEDVRANLPEAIRGFWPAP
mgnify:FL=1